MKKKILLISTFVLCICTACVATAFAFWQPKLKSDENMVAVGTFIDVRLSTDLDGTEFDAGQSLTAVFKVLKYLNDGESYRLELCNIKFYDEQTQADWAEHTGLVWEFTFYTQPTEPDSLVWVDLEATTLLEDVINGDSVTMLLRLKSDADMTYRLGTLEFSARLSANEGEDG